MEDKSLASRAASIANKFINHEHRAQRINFVLGYNFRAGRLVVDYPEDYAATFIDSMAQFHVEHGGKPLSFVDRGVERKGWNEQDAQLENGG